MKFKTLAWVFLAAVVCAATVSLAEDQAGQLVRLKAGAISFTLLQSDGVTPLSSAPIRMLATDDNRVLAESTSDKSGQAAMALAEGRYLLNVSGTTLAILEAASDATVASCRVVIPAGALLVAGAEGEEDEGNQKKGAFWLNPVVVGGVVVLAAVGGYAIYDNNNDDDGDDNGGGNPPPPPPSGGNGGGGGDDDDDEEDTVPPPADNRGNSGGAPAAPSQL